MKTMDDELVARRLYPFRPIPMVKNSNGCNDAPGLAVQPKSALESYVWKDEFILLLFSR
jgi:hypothetical protein